MRKISALQLSIAERAAELVALANEKNTTLGTAESCTGGLIAASITDISGASAVFYGGVVSYSNSVKAGLLGVEEEILAAHGAVSAETAVQMAWGAVSALGVDHAVAVTGIAGPGGGTPEKPVGLVYIATASAIDKKDGIWSGNTNVTENHFEGDRAEVRLQTVEKALSMLLSALEPSNT